MTIDVRDTALDNTTYGSVIYDLKGTDAQRKADIGTARYSLGEIVDQDNVSYGIGVHLDSTLLATLSPDERVAMVKEYVKELGGQSFTAYDRDGNEVSFTIAKPGEKFVNRHGKHKPVTKDLTSKFIGSETKQESIALIDELIVTSKQGGTTPPKYPHGWLDNNGQNDWEYWTTYVQDKNNTIWKVTLNIATAADGRKILYDINPIKKAGQSVGKSDTIPADGIVSQDHPSVNPQFSLSDSDGNQLSKGQQEYFLDSKVRDENGNLMVMYHGTECYCFEEKRILWSICDMIFRLYVKIHRYLEETCTAVHGS